MIEKERNDGESQMYKSCTLLWNHHFVRTINVHGFRGSSLPTNVRPEILIIYEHLIGSENKNNITVINNIYNRLDYANEKLPKTSPWRKVYS